MTQRMKFVRVQEDIGFWFFGKSVNFPLRRVVSITRRYGSSGCYISVRLDEDEDLPLSVEEGEALIEALKDAALWIGETE